jgi:23S rRNA G2445 N2-methylase RlmL
MADLLQLVGPPGTNKVMAGELSRLARRGLGLALPSPTKRGSGAIAVPFTPELAHLAVWYHRTAARVLWQVASTRARRLEPAYAELSAAVRTHPGGWLRDRGTISVIARNVGEFAAGERQVVGMVKNAVIDGAAARGIRLTVDPAAPDLLIAVRLHDDELSVTVDLAGGPMNKRGYRTAGGAAPLRETLAAALVMLARHDSRREPLLDPMAGSGTIAIEAAAMAQGAPVWVPPRRPSLDRLPAFAGLAAAPTPPLFADTHPRVVANELDPRTARAARSNAVAAGYGDRLRVETGDFRRLDRARVAELAGTGACGVILCNPPYGERLGRGEIDALYRDLGQWLRGFAGWRAGFLVASPAFERQLVLTARVRKPLSARPLTGWFYLFELN